MSHSERPVVPADMGVLLLPLFPVLLGYVWVMVSLRGMKLKKGLALGLGLGSLNSLYLLLLFLKSASEFRYYGWLAVSYAGVSALPPAVLVGSAIKTYYKLSRDVTDERTLRRGVGLALALFAVTLLLAALLIPGTLRSPIAALQASVVGSLRTINVSQIIYAETYKKGYSPSLKALGPPPGSGQPSASTADLIDGVLASGNKSGYFFVYRPGPPDETGYIKTFTVGAGPVEYGNAGRINYFNDESGVIRVIGENRPATAKDSPLAGY